MLAIALVAFMTGSLRNKASELKKYQQIGSGKSGTSGKPGQVSMTTSYQNPASADYAIPTQQKDVTYCVIDGRLVDQ